MAVAFGRTVTNVTKNTASKVGKNLGKKVVPKTLEESVEKTTKETVQQSARNAGKNLTDGLKQVNLKKVGLGLGAVAGVGLGSWFLIDPKSLGVKIGETIKPISENLAQVVGDVAGSAVNGTIDGLAKSLGISRQQFIMIIALIILLGVYSQFS